MITQSNIIKYNNLNELINIITKKVVARLNDDSIFLKKIKYQIQVILVSLIVKVAMGADFVQAEGLKTLAN